MSLKATRWRVLKAEKQSKPALILQNASYFERFKAQVVDTFMIYTPILYITTYFILDGASDFRQNDVAHFLAVLAYGVIVSLFVSLSAQTPGCKAQNIAIVDENEQKIGFFRALLRFFLYLLTALCFFGIFIPHIRRQRSTLHDWVCKTRVIVKG